jgi:CspA family cold shock protein
MTGNGGPVGAGTKATAADSVQERKPSSLSELESNVEIFEVSGFVKWFDVARGYGFIIPDNGIADILLHLSCLKRDGFDAPLEGTRVVCEAVQRQKGIQCLRVLSVDNSTAIHPVERTARTHQQVSAGAEWTRVKVKWFNRTRGFGFASETESSPDIFIHMEVLRKTAISELQPDQWIYVRFGDGPKGKMAAEVRLTLDDDRLPGTN